MRISELSATAGVSVTTIKYYLREGLLHAGTRTARTQALYDDSHVRRLRLVRALLGPGGLRIDGARAVLTALEDPPAGRDELLGLAAGAVTRATSEAVDTREAERLLDRWGWDAADCDPAAMRDLASALQACVEADLVLSDEALDRYAAAMTWVARQEVADVPDSSAADAVRHVVLGTVLVEPLLLSLRRVAHQQASRELFGRPSN